MQLTAHKVSWENGSKAAISVRKTAGVSAVLPKAPAAWSVDLDDDEELVDDEELLTEEDRKRPIVPGAHFLRPCQTPAEICMIYSV